MTTTAGKALVFLNLLAAGLLLAWGLSAFANSPAWVDAGEGADKKDGEITVLKKEVDRLTKAVAGTHDSYAAKAAGLATSERVRAVRKAKLAEWEQEAKGGVFKTIPESGDGVFYDVSPDGARRRLDILGPDGKPLQGLDTLRKLYKAQIDDANLQRDGRQAAQQAEWMNIDALLMDQRMAGLGIGDLRLLHARLSDQIQVLDVAADKQRVIATNLADEAAYLKDARVDWTARLQTLERRNQQLRDRLKELGAE